MLRAQLGKPLQPTSQKPKKTITIVEIQGQYNFILILNLMGAEHVVDSVTVPPTLLTPVANVLSQNLGRYLHLDLGEKKLTRKTKS